MAASTAKKKPAKRMTQREKNERARIKKEFQAQGIIPPNKPRLNRKKFAREVWTEFEAMDPVRRNYFLLKAISCMVGPDMQNVTPEEVGVIKALKIAVEMGRFSERLEADGRDQYTVGELIDEVVLPIMRF